jgi:hypothetical protein
MLLRGRCGHALLYVAPPNFRCALGQLVACDVTSVELRASLSQQVHSPGRFPPGPGAIYVRVCEKDRQSVCAGRFTRNHAHGTIWDVPRLV